MPNNTPNSIKPTRTDTFTAPPGGVVAGEAYQVGAFLVVAGNTVAEGLPFAGMTEGVCPLPKAAGIAWADGQPLYWDSKAKSLVIAPSATARRAGCAVGSAAAKDTVGQVRLTNTGT